jgi:MOSC domain-containing protein YiiM
VAIERVAHVERERLEAGIAELEAAPGDEGSLELIATRPALYERELLDAGRLDLELGLVGDNWSRRPNRDTADGGPDPDAQVTVMGARAAALFADGSDHAAWAWAGDQLYVDLDLSVDNLPPRTRLAVGESAVVEVTEEPHLGCGKFIKRYGVDALKFVNSATGRAMRLRGLNARVVEPGEVRRGDIVRKLPEPARPS